MLGTQDPTPGMPPFPASISFGGGLVFVPTETGELVAIEVETGHIQWRCPLRADHKLRTLGVTFWNSAILIGAEHLAELPTRDLAAHRPRWSVPSLTWSPTTPGSWR
jgi:hypothetical protein